MTENLGEIVRRRRQDLGLTQEQLAALAHLSKATIQNVEKKTEVRLRGSNLLRLAQALGLTPEQFRSGELPPPPAALARNPAALPFAGGPGMRTIPLINRVPAGAPAGYTDLDYPAGHGDAQLPASLYPHDPSAFAVVVEGDSMAPVFNHGDVVICSPALREQVQDGDVVVVRLADDSCTVKRIRRLDQEKRELYPINPSHPARVVDRAALIQCNPVVVQIVNHYLRRRWHQATPMALTQAAPAPAPAPAAAPPKWDAANHGAGPIRNADQARRLLRDLHKTTGKSPRKG